MPRLAYLFPILCNACSWLCTLCTLIPIPKGKSANVADSGNYRGIALSSIFGKIYDLIFLSKFSDCLITSTWQFGFKRKHLTSMCTMVLKETLAQWTVVLPFAHYSMPQKHLIAWITVNCLPSWWVAIFLPNTCVCCWICILAVLLECLVTLALRQWPNALCVSSTAAGLKVSVQNWSNTLGIWPNVWCAHLVKCCAFRQLVICAAHFVSNAPYIT